jgi:hypothetical protein
MTHHELLLMLRRSRIWYLMIFLVVLFASAYFMIPWVMKYEGESTFYLANESLVNPAAFSQKSQNDILQVSLVQERVYQLAYSTEMMTYMINRFKLYEHYGIDTTQVYYYEKAVRKLTKNILFNKLTGDLSSIVVIDRNNEMAAAMANAVVWKLDQLNKKYLIDKIQTNLNFYDSYLKESLVISREQNQKLMDNMDQLKMLRDQRAPGGRPLSEVEFSLYQAVNTIEGMTSQLIMARNLYSNALSAQKVKNLPSLVIIKRALPDLRSKKYMLATCAVLAGLLACFLFILLQYAVISNRKDLKILFGRSLPPAT